MRLSIAAPFFSVLFLSGCISHSGKPDGRSPQSVNTHFSVQKNVIYTPAGWSQPQTADVYIPSEPGVYPGVVVVHGGGWDGRDRSDMESISEKLAQHGYVVANMDYRLAPASLYPAQLDDVRAAVKWMRSNAARLKLDPQRVGGWGYSAGAHLVALAATFDGPAESQLQAVVAGGLPADFTHYPNSPIITKFIGATYAEKPKTWIEASPISHVSNNDPPMFLYHGKWDRLVYVEDSIAMNEALKNAKVPTELYLVSGGAHITTFLFGFGAESAGIEFLDRYLRPTR